MRWIVAAGMLAVSPFAFQAAVADSEVLIFPGEEAVIHFRFQEPPVSDEGPVNFLAFAAGGSYVDFLGDSLIEQTVRDGNTPLAVREAFRHNGMTGLFVSEDSPWSGVEMDFETISDGSIEGVLVVRPTFEAGSDQSRIRFRGRLVTGTATGENSFAPGPDAEIISCFIDAPVFSDRFEQLSAEARRIREPRTCEFGTGEG